jgi:NAD(P)-dependent dehydrogenase (short-subunit alcohol dehydrogenase family)
MYQFSEKVVLITGAAGNLGQAIAQVFANAGASLALVDISPDGLATAKNALNNNVKCLTIPTDLINPQSVAELVRQTMEQFQHIDILVNVAGGFTMGPPLHETLDRDWDFMFNLNTRTVFNCCRAVIPIMLQQHNGTIINISARAAIVGQPNMSPYCASKAAVITLTESLAAEHRLTGIRVNCILPSIIDTPQNRTAMPNADYATWVSPTALANVIMFLASDAANCITGAAIPVYGRS